MLRLLAGAALLGVVAVAPTEASAPTGAPGVEPLTFRSTGPTTFSPPDRFCPVVRITVEVVIVDTRDQGALEICVRSIRPTGGITQTVDALFTYTFRNGTLRAHMDLDESVDEAHTTLAQRGTGDVTRALGMFGGFKRGTVVGGGVARFAPDGRATSYLTYGAFPRS
jgi:hypothetical protein